MADLPVGLFISGVAAVFCLKKLLRLNLLASASEVH